MLNNTTVALPGVHMAGSDAHYDAHIEVGPHGFALFLAPDAEYPVLDVNSTSAQLDVVVGDLQAALASRCASSADSYPVAGRGASDEAATFGSKGRTAIDAT